MHIPHRLHRILWPLITIVEPESWILIAFILTTLNIGTYRPYLLITCLFIGALYLVNKNFLHSAWLGFVATYLLRQAKYFVKPYVAPDNYLELGLRPPEIIFFVAFSDALLVLLLYLVFRNYILHKKNYKFPNKAFPVSPLLLIVALGGMSSYFSSLPEISWFYLLQLLKLFIISLLAMALCTNEILRKKTLEVVFIYSLFLAILVILQKLNGGPLGLAIEERYTLYAGRFADESPSLYRPGGIFWDANLTASILTMILPLWFIFSLKRGLFNLLFMGTGFVIASIALILTASRAAWIISLILLVISYRLIIKKPTVIIPGWVKKYWFIPAIIFGIIWGPMIIDRLWSLGQVFQTNGGAIYRLRHLEMAAYFMLTRPLGLGVNVFQFEILNRWQPKYYLFDSTPAHNLFAQIGSELGIGGLLLFSWFLVKLAKQGRKWLTHTNRLLPQALMIGCFGYILTSLVYPWWLAIPISGLFWLLLGLAYV